MQDDQGKKHWQGKYFGRDGAIKKPLFALLSTLYSAYPSASTRREKFLVVLVTVVLFFLARSLYDIKDLSGEELDILATIARKMRRHRLAIVYGEAALRETCNFTSRMLIIAGLMRDHDAVYSGSSPSSRAHQLFVFLRQEHHAGPYDPPEQKIRIYRALCWFASKYSPSEKKEEAIMYYRQAEGLADRLGAFDQLKKLDQEFPELMRATNPST